MPSIAKRWLFLGIVSCLLVLSFYKSFSWRGSLETSGPYRGFKRPSPTSKWSLYKQKYPVKSPRKLPSGPLQPIPAIQYDFRDESLDQRNTREARLNAVRASFAHAWKGYRERAWGKDEVAPLSGGYRTTFGGWAATLVDSLDSLYIMGFHSEFDEAVMAVSQIDFTTPQSETINVFETTIRYLGGLLSAYDLSGRDILLNKAVELGEMLYAAFDTEYRIPVARWNWTNALEGNFQFPEEAIIVAESTSLSLEFTRLSQITGDSRYYDAVARIADLFQGQQGRTKLPGMWPIVFYGSRADTTIHNEFSLGAMADSLYEYLPKMHLLLGGVEPQYRPMYEAAIKIAKHTLFFRPLVPQNHDILVSGIVTAGTESNVLKPEGQHLVCFAGGMMAIGAKIFGLDDMTVARKLTDGCIWAYEQSPSGIMPETFSLIPCKGGCEYDEAVWKSSLMEVALGNQEIFDEMVKDGNSPPPFTLISNSAYLLRPEAIESVFVLYRATGDLVLQEKGWKMFQAIEKATRTDIAHAALKDVKQQKPPQIDKMESFWTAETLKYFFLLFSDSKTISLDEWVLNTEAHPFKRPH